MENQGFKTVEGVAGHRVLWLESARLGECLDYYYGQGFDGIGISPKMGFDLRDLSFLSEHTGIEHVVLLDVAGFDLSGLTYLNKLRYLQLSGYSGNIDFSTFSSLRHLRVEWSAGFKLPTGPNLERLAIRAFKPRVADLQMLDGLSNLRALEINLSTLVTLAGIEALNRLEELSLSYMSRLVDVQAIESLRPRISDLTIAR